jgi:hypothetical protein
MKLWIKISLVIAALAGAGLALWYFLFRKKPVSKAVTSGQTALPDGYEVNVTTGIVTLNGVIVGKDNGDDSWTSVTGAVIDYNGNFLGNAPMNPTQLATFFASASAGQATAPVQTQTAPMTASQLAAYVASAPSASAPDSTLNQTDVNTAFKAANLG